MHIPSLLLGAATIFAAPAQAIVRQLGTKALSTCMENSQISASHFDVTYTPNNKTLTFDINGKSTVSGNVIVTLEVFAYGIQAVTKTIDPCTTDLTQLCPIEADDIDVTSQTTVDDSVADQVPGIAYTVPDIDGYVKIYINSSTTGKQLACLRADITNGRSVDVEGVAWVTGAIAAIALLVSLIVSGLAHPNAAAHVATNAVSLIFYFHGQALVGLLAVELPPIVRAWTQNFQWSNGIINVKWMQNIMTWYVKSTNGTPSTYLVNTVKSVVLQKRDVGLSDLAKRAVKTDASTNVDILSGVDRVAYVAGIEDTNVFITFVSWWTILLFVAAASLLLFKAIITILVKRNKLASDKFIEFRQGWKVVLKGMIYRIILMTYPAVVTMCLWELTHRDSVGCVVLAIVLLLFNTVLIGYAAFRVIRLARRSLQLHQNAAYILFSDPKQLSRWGFLYIQFRAALYWFIIPFLGYLFLKAAFTGLGQASQVFQAIAFIVIEAAYFGLVVGLRPFMDRRTNIFNIAIVSVNFFNAILLVFFTNIFGIKAIVTGVMGVIFFVVNAIFSTILLIMIICSCAYALFAKNPDVRYQRMKDERNSYLKSKTNLALTTELDNISSSDSGSNKNGGGVTSRKEMFSEADIVDEYHKEPKFTAYQNGSSSSLLNRPPAIPAAGGRAPNSPTEREPLRQPSPAFAGAGGQDPWDPRRGTHDSGSFRTMSPGPMAGGHATPASPYSFSGTTAGGRSSPALRAPVPQRVQPGQFTQQHTAYQGYQNHPSAAAGAGATGGNGYGGSGLPSLGDDLQAPSLPFASGGNHAGAGSRRGSPAGEDRWRVGVGYHH
ncbi:Putative flavin carrier protein 3 [Savitreella phatthalungensis]